MEAGDKEVEINRASWRSETRTKRTLESRERPSGKTPTVQLEEARPNHAAIHDALLNFKPPEYVQCKLEYWAT